MKILINSLLSLSLVGCASTTAYYPPLTAYDDKGRTRTISSKAFQTYGDSLGATEVTISNTGVRYAAAMGNMNSPTTAIIAGEVGRTTRFGMSALAWYGILKAAFGLGQGISNNVANTSTTNAATNAAAKTSSSSASASSTLPTVGSTIPAQTTATVGEAVLPAAGSTIPSTIPSVVTPVP